MRNIILSVIALASSVSAIGNATVKNNSTGTFYVWSVGESPGPKKTVAPGKLLITRVALASSRGKSFRMHSDNDNGISRVHCIISYLVPVVYSPSFCIINLAQVALSPNHFVEMQSPGALPSKSPR
jgi:hypothetical protein